MSESEEQLKLGRIIRKYRELNEMTQKDLADILDVTEKAVSSWEVNAATPRIGKLQKMAEAFGCKTSDMIAESEKEYFDKKFPSYAFDKERNIFIEFPQDNNESISAPKGNVVQELKPEEKDGLISLLAKLNIAQLQKVRNYINMLIDLKQ